MSGVQQFEQEEFTLDPATSPIRTTAYCTVHDFQHDFQTWISLLQMLDVTWMLLLVLTQTRTISSCRHVPERAVVRPGIHRCHTRTAAVANQNYF